ncbi:MAG: ATP-binding protein, partial [Gammaproteobacteria bacterium]|nr:ATP-binding protein [Gammaproteobacteria bacterium]
MKLVDSIPNLRSERESPYVFVGRKTELGVLHTFWDQIVNYQSYQKVLFLIHGIQGIGKTQFMTHFANQLQQIYSENKKSVFVHLVLHISNLTLQEARVSLEETLMRKRKVLKSIKRFDVRIFGTGAGVEQFDQQSLSFNSMLTKMASWEPKPLILVTIDEVQQLKEEGVAVLELLHHGINGLPMMVLCAGHQHSTSILERFGLSRLGKVINLSLLEHEDCLNAFHSMGTNWDLDIEDAE